MPAKKILNLCLDFRMDPFQYQKPSTLLRDLTRRLLFADVFITFPSRRLPGVDFRPIPFPLPNLFKVSRTFSRSMIHLAALAVIPMMKPRILPRLVLTLYTLLPQIGR